MLRIIPKRPEEKRTTRATVPPFVTTYSEKTNVLNQRQQQKLVAMTAAFVVVEFYVTYLHHAILNRNALYNI